MKKYLDSYNDSIHSSFGCTPQEMLDDIKLEGAYILKQLKHKEEQSKIKILN